MIIYTNLNHLSVTFARLQEIAKIYNIVLRNGLVDDFEKDGRIITGSVITKIGQSIHIKNAPKETILFWFAKSNKKLSFYRVIESLESIYNGLKVLENHKDIIK